MSVQQVDDIIAQFLQQQDNKQKVVQLLSKKGFSEDITNDALLDILKQQQFCKPLLLAINSVQLQKDWPVEQEENQQKSKNKTTLLVRLQNGRKWNNLKQLKVFFFFKGFRQQLIMASPTSVIKFQAPIPNFNIQQLKRDQDKIELSFYEQGIGLISIKQVQWKYVLAYGSTTFSLQLNKIQKEGGRLGIIDILMDISPKNTKLSISQQVLNNRLQAIRNIEKRDLETFYEYSDKWYLEHKRVLANPQNTIIYMQTQDLVHRPVLSFVYPLNKVRGLDTPSIALRFVSLIPIRKSRPGLSQPLQKFHSLLQNNYGSNLDHCNLLCSLLLGMGLTAYVAMGFTQLGSHCWVVTIEKQNKYQYWQTSNGKRYNFNDSKAKSFYKRVFCLYSFKQYYAFLQGQKEINFDIQNNNKWIYINPAKLQYIHPINKYLSLIYNPAKLIQEQLAIQQDIRQAIRKSRQIKNKKITKFDTQLQGILGMTLTNYQFQKISGHTFDNQYFKTAVKNLTPRNHTFVAIPIQVLQFDCDKVLNSIRKFNEGNELLQGRKEQGRLGFRLKMNYYGDKVKVGWAMLAAIIKI